MLLEILLFIASCSSSPAAVDVYAAFMNDEANEVIKAAIRTHREVIVIAVGDVKGELAGRPLNYYASDRPTILQTRSDLGGETVEARLAHGLGKRMNPVEFSSHIESLTAGGAAARTVLGGKANPVLSIIRFNPQARTRNPIVIITGIEMGRQPSLVQPYLDVVFSAIHDLSEASPKRGGMTLSVFATSGGVSERLNPGDLTSVRSSVFIGAEVIPHPTGPKTYDGVVALISENHVKSIFKKNFSTREEAEKAAKEAFLQLKQKDISSTPLLSGTSLTASFFVGPELKEQGQKLGLINANMEDFHILSSASRAPFRDLQISRLITDPPSIPEALRKAVGNWAKTTRYTFRHYEDAIFWGLQGSSLESVPNTARWSAFDRLSGTDLTKYLPHLMIDGKLSVLDPFLVEIASEFLNEAMNGQTLTTLIKGEKSFEGAISYSITDGLSPEQISRLNELMEVRTKKIQTQARRIKDLANQNVQPADLRREIRKLIALHADLEIPTEHPLLGELINNLESRIRLADSESSPDHARVTSLSKKLEFLKLHQRIPLLRAEEEPGAETHQHLEKWVVPFRWDGNIGRKVSYLHLSALTSAQVDRAFYRVGLLSLTRSAAADWFKTRHQDLAQKYDLTRAERILMIFCKKHGILKELPH